ncbi:MAG TPA: hypothetical protein VGQ32_02565, partial [Thermoanaerobaculia bacterium]|nr:hypothetical protein [Thermoanaerobaculia bacterium]
CGPGHLKSVADFAARRRTRERAGMNRLYCVESVPGVTGASADHRFPMRASDVEAFARSVAGFLEGGGASPAPALARAIAEDLKAHRGRSLIVAGDSQPAAVHALAHAMNEALGNVGQTVSYVDPIPVRADSQADSFRQLVSDMQAGSVEALLIVGGNPVFTAPGDLPFGKALEKVKLSAHLSPHQDETSALCRWHVPQAHFLESWSDARAFDGTASIVQPLIAPLYSGKTAHEAIAALTNQPERTSYEIVRDFWKDRMGADFEGAWRKALHDGVIVGSASQFKALRAGGSTTGREGQAPPLRHEGSGKTDLEIQFRPDPTVYDGRFANNGWLQELPKPITKLTWDNAVLLAPATAKKLGLGNEDVVRVSWGGRSAEGPVWIVPGHAGTPRRFTTATGGRARASSDRRPGSTRPCCAPSPRSPAAPGWRSRRPAGPTRSRRRRATTAWKGARSSARRRSRSSRRTTSSSTRCPRRRAPRSPCTRSTPRTTTRGRWRSI